MRRPGIRGLAIALTIALFACDDPFEALLQPVPEEPSEASLTDLRTGRLQDPPAFDLLFRTPVRIDLTNQWDFLYRVTAAGEAQLLPFGALADSASEAGLRSMPDAFDGVRTAPVDGYVQRDPVPVAEGDVLVARTRRDPQRLFSCRRYAKLQILEIDQAAGRITFQYLVNPNCEDRVLVPGEHGNP